jgi:hypothetical protein
MKEEVSVYWFNSASGDVYLSEDQLPQNKRHLYLVINREKLHFGTFSLHTRKRVKDANILNIQGHFIPFKSDFMNFIYSNDKQKQQDKHYFFWVGSLTSDLRVESFFYDEIPETLMFKGDPETVKTYDFFVFQRVSGFEIIYFNPQTQDFYSSFVKEAEKITGQIIALLRKFAGTGKQKFKILIDGDIPMIQRLQRDYGVEVDLLENREDKYFFFPDFVPIKKKFSNLSQSKQIKSIKAIARQWSRNLTLVIAMLVVIILLNGWGWFRLKADNTDLEQRFSEVGKLMAASEAIEFRLNKINAAISRYPDHMLALKTIAGGMDEDGVLINYSLGDGRILLEGYSADSLGLLTRLRQSGQFQDVRFKTTVTKNVHSQREKFEIEILLMTRGAQSPHVSPGDDKSAGERREAGGV